jgi:hypothetical protein
VGAIVTLDITDELLDLSDKGDQEGVADFLLARLAEVCQLAEGRVRLGTSLGLYVLKKDPSWYCEIYFVERGGNHLLGTIDTRRFNWARFNGPAPALGLRFAGKTTDDNLNTVWFWARGQGGDE